MERETESILEMHQISKYFGPVKALDKVSISVKEGTIHGIAGENGAGKSTLMKVLSGVYPQGDFDGEILFRNKPCHFQNIRESEEFGIVIIHQELSLFGNLSIAENIFMGKEIHKYGIVNEKKREQESRRILDRLHCKLDSNIQVSKIGIGHQQLVEIAKALSKNVKLLILDEPTASLNDDESHFLLNILLELKEQGISSILISHKLYELEKVADCVTVLRDGRAIESFALKKDAAEASSEKMEERIIAAMVGRSLEQRYPKREFKQGSSQNCAEAVETGEAVLRVQDWNVHTLGHHVLKDINFYIGHGEVVGLAGLIGAGRTELAKSLFGRSYGDEISGELFLKGKVCDLKNAYEALDAGLVYLPEDRKQEGLILQSSIRNNVVLSSLEQFCSLKIQGLLGVLDDDAIAQDASKAVKKMKTKYSNINDPVSSLSGGNQQKIVLARSLFLDPLVLILDEPTRGIDVGAKYDIYSVINGLIQSGMSCLLISSDMPEIIGMCDRAYVLNEGELAGELQGAELTQENIMSCIIRHKVI